MRIIVCVKQVPDTNDIKMDPVTNTIIREGVVSILNPFDTYAVEEALRIREKREARLISLSMGIPQASLVLKETVALGMDEAYLLSDKAFAGADTMATANALAMGVRKLGGADLILCGKMAIDGDTAQVGPMLGEVLNLPHLTDISKILEIGNDFIRCRKLTDDGYVEAEIGLPAILTVVKEINVPRLPSISGMLKGRNWQVPVWSAQDVQADKRLIGLSGSPTQVVKTFIPRRERNCCLLEGTLTEKTEGLLQALEKMNLIRRDEESAKREAI